MMRNWLTVGPRPHARAVEGPAGLVHEEGAESCELRLEVDLPEEFCPCGRLAGGHGGDGAGGEMVQRK